MRLAIMQPYFMPYIGYFQLIKAVDKFVIYDNIQYTKKGWINRNRILVEGEDTFITLSLEKDSDFQNVINRKISTSFNRKKLINQINGAYSKANYFKDIFPMIEQIVMSNESNLFYYIFNSITTICCYIGINTSKFIVSSTIDIDHSLKGKDKVLSLCKQISADTYINSIGGQELYNKEEFNQYAIDLKFIKTNECIYKQFNNNFFIPNLSIIDVLMHNGKEKTQRLLDEYTLI